MFFKQCHASCTFFFFCKRSRSLSLAHKHKFYYLHILRGKKKFYAKCFGCHRCKVHHSEYFIALQHLRHNECIMNAHIPRRAKKNPWRKLGVKIDFTFSKTDNVTNIMLSTFKISIKFLVQNFSETNCSNDILLVMNKKVFSF